MLKKTSALLKENITQTERLINENEGVLQTKKVGKNCGSPEGEKWCTEVQHDDIF